MSLTSAVKVSVSAQYAKGSDLEAPQDLLSLARAIAFANGVGNNQADLLWSDTRPIAGSGTENLDFAGAMTDAFGLSLVFLKVKAILIYAKPDNVNAVRVTRPAANGLALFLAASDGLDVLPGGLFVFVAPGAGVPVVAGTGDLLKVDNSAAGADVVYDVVVIGTSA